MKRPTVARRGVVRRGRVALAAVVGVVALLAIPGAALAQSIGPTDDQYDPTSEQIESSVAGGSGSGSTGSGSGDPPGDSSESSGRVVSGLPFTGADIGLLGAVAALLGAGGLALRKLGNSRAGS